MGEQQWRVNLVGMEQRTLLGVHLLVVPGIATGTGHLAIAVAPVALTPVAGDVADAGMADGAGKDIGNGLQILGGETTVGGAYAAHPFCIGKTVSGTELLHSLDDVVGHILSPGVHVAGAVLLAKSAGTTRVDHVDDISQRGIIDLWIAALKIARRGRATTIVVDDDGIFLRCVEVGWEIITSVDGVAT